MKINVGSKNKAKVGAVDEIVREYPHLAQAEVIAHEVESEVNGQPMSLEETIRGARNRARNAFQDCDLSIGLESGLMDVPYTKTGHMDVCACAIYDGKVYHLGLSSAFEYPQAVIDLVKNEHIEITAAFVKLGAFSDPREREKGGAIGYLTKGRLQRKEFTKQAIRQALIHIDV